MPSPESGGGKGPPATLGRHLDVWRGAWLEQQKEAKSLALSAREAEFLPAVLEIQESPPSPIGRAITWLIIALFVTAVVWATVGTMDIVSVAQGKIIPSGYSKVIQPLESGVISAIHVRDGQEVKAGDVLIDLDATVTAADEEKTANEYRAAKMESARLRALLAWKETIEVPPGSDPRYVTLQLQLLHDQLAEQRARLGAVQQQVEQRKAVIDGTKSEITKLQATVPMLTQKAEAYRKLLKDQYVAELQYLDAEQARIEAVQNLESQKKKLNQDQAALAEAERNYDRMKSDIQQGRMAELTANETKASSLAQEVVKAGQKTGQQRLTAPIDGVIQQLVVHTIGGVVTPAQQLMLVVPREHQLEVEAMVENKDIGFVKEGQPVEVKIETFPFTIYGAIPGKVLTVSDDAIEQEKVGLVYAARVSMERSTIDLGDKVVTLSPGMAVTVDIQTGQRRLIEFILSPLLKSLKESARER
nr:HlyD family type I secretion periplasmic adaptor subunit [Nitrospirota bacterium]